MCENLWRENTFFAFWRTGRIRSGPLRIGGRQAAAGGCRRTRERARGGRGQRKNVSERLRQRGQRERGGCYTTTVSSNSHIRFPLPSPPTLYYYVCALVGVQAPATCQRPPIGRNSPFPNEHVASKAGKQGQARSRIAVTLKSPLLAWPLLA